MSRSATAVRSRSASRSTVRLTLAILMVLALPALFFYFGLASSLALGTSAVGCGIIIFFALRLHSNQSGALIGKLSQGVCVVVLTVFVLFHLAVASFVGETDLTRAGASIVPMAIIFLAASYVARFMAEISSANLHAATRQAFLWMCGIAAIAAAGFTVPGQNASSKPVFPFTEPSHFALSFIPLLMYSSVKGPMWSRVAALFAGLACAVLLQNLTLVVGCLLVVCISFRIRTTVALGVLIGVAAMAMQMDLSYFVDRINFSGDTENLSTLVYLQGWQLIGESWQKSGGWGLGFQQLGITETEVPAAIQIFKTSGEYLNLLDGGFDLSKILSEFGIAGILMILLFLIFAARSFWKLRRSALSDIDNDVPATIAHCFVLSFLIELLVRGSGYFTPTILLMLASVIFLSRLEESSDNRYVLNL